uniref:GST C-terminal domain-containing protein n=1 Tax=Cucumis sativus TaxID=3659 RepID=A0A0A0L2F4_CUCSA
MPAVLRVARSQEDEREKGIEEAEETLEPLEKELNIVGLILAGWIPATEEAIGFELLSAHKFPNLTKWSQHFVNHSVAKEVLPEKNFLVNFLKNVTFRPKNN